MDYLDKFNQTFREFGDEIVKTFPDDNEFRMYNVAIQAALLIKPDVVLDIFHSRVIVPFGDRILARDESFFLDHTYGEVTADIEEAAAIIDKVKSYYKDMSDENREIVWQYFRLLVKLGNRIRT
jgi:hypothetical protein